MQTKLADFIKDTTQGKEADDILRKCVHCGFCTATCPTYQLLGDELDGPRGRIYLIKQALEGNPVSGRTLVHLDRCLTCRACETTCPSGVRYGRLVEIGRDVVQKANDEGDGKNFMTGNKIFHQSTPEFPGLRKGEAFYYAFGEYDVIGIVEMPDNVSMAAFSLTVSAGGAVKAFKTTPLMTIEEGIEAMRKAGGTGYRPPGS